MVTERAASRGKKKKGRRKAAEKLVRQSVGHSLAQLLEPNIMWDKILKRIQDGVGAGSLFGAIY